MLNIAVLVSGGGTNLQALIDAEKAGKIENGRISGRRREQARAFTRLSAPETRASRALCWPARTLKASTITARALEKLLKEKKTDLIVLAAL